MPRTLSPEEALRIAAIRERLRNIPPRPYRKVAYNWHGHGPQHWSGAIHSANGPQGELRTAEVYAGSGSFYALDESVVDFLVAAPDDIEWFLSVLQDLGLDA